jgi:hypothetical protein
MHLDGLTVEVKRLLGNHCSPFGKELLSLFLRCAVKIAQTVILKVLGKTLECLFISSCRSDTMDVPVALMVMPSLP